MEKTLTKRIFITAKTYPNLSTKNIETICTAGICNDGKWVRIYPINYRNMNQSQRFKKYQWIEVNTIPSESDPRKESHKIVGDIKILNHVDTKNGWKKRKNIVLNNIYTDLQLLINEARNKNIYTSLAVFRPSKIIGFHMSKNCSAKNNNKLKKILNKKPLDSTIKLSEQISYKFYYKIMDKYGKHSRMQILDWEIYQLYRKLAYKYGNKRDLIYKNLRRKYFDDLAHNKDIYLFLGTTKYWHIRRSKNPFTIIGIFYPPKES